MTEIEVTPAPVGEPRAPAFHDEDAAKRFQHDLRLHQLVLSRDELVARRFMAVSLTDGRTDGVAYESRNEAVNRQRSNGDGNRCLYFQIPLERIGVKACDSILWYARRAYLAGYRPVGVHERSELHQPTRWEALLGPDGMPLR